MKVHKSKSWKYKRSLKCTNLYNKLKKHSRILFKEIYWDNVWVINKEMIQNCLYTTASCKTCRYFVMIASESRSIKRHLKYFEFILCTETNALTVRVTTRITSFSIMMRKL